MLNSEEAVNRPSSKMLSGIALALALSLAGPAVVQAQDADAVTDYRKSLMQAFRTHMGGVRAAMSGTAPMGHAEHHAVSFEKMAQALSNSFPENTMGEGTRALPAIWENRADFMNKVSAIQSATARLVTVSRSGDAEAIGEAMQAVQGTCQSCHQAYRGPAN